MSKLIILITAHIDKGIQVAEAWEAAGAPGVTLIDSFGLHDLRKRGSALELPLFVSMAQVMRQIEQTNQMLLSVVDDDVVDKLIEAAGKVLGNLSDAHTGVAFVLDVEHVIGIPNFPRSSGSPKP